MFSLCSRDIAAGNVQIGLKELRLGAIGYRERTLTYEEVSQ